MRWPWEPVERLEAVAGSVVVPGEGKSGLSVEEEKRKLMPEEWQNRAWDYWDDLGELYFPTTYLARQVSRVRWEAIGTDGEPLEEGQSEEIIDEVTKGLGGEEASRQISLNLLVAGDGNYVKRQETSNFRVISTATPKRSEILGGGDNDDSTKPFINLRFYNPDPRDTDRATSSVRPALGPAEELLTLEALSRSQARSRIAQAGLFLWPEEAKFGAQDPIETALELAMSLAIADVNHPSAFVPVKASIAAELIDLPRHITFDRPYDDKINSKIELATKRIALALDMPAELLLGMGDINHWGAWLISEETYSAHVGPLAQQVGEVFAAAYDALHPNDEARIIEIRPDASELLAHRSTVRDAFDALEHRVVGFKFVRDILGADDEDAPTDEDLALMGDVEGRDPLVDETRGAPESDIVGATITGAAEAKQLAEIVQKIYLGVGVVLTADEARTVINAAGAELPMGFEPASKGVAAAMDGKIDLDQLSHDLDQIDVAVLGELIGQTEATGAAVMEKIGVRARAKAKDMGDTVIIDKIADVPFSDIGPTLGLQQLLLLGVEVDKLVDEGTARLSKWWTRRVPQAYAQVGKLGLEIHADFDALAERSDEILKSTVEKWLLSNLDRDEPLAVPTDGLRATLAAAGGQ